MFGGARRGNKREMFRRHTCAAEEPYPAARQICAKRVAFSLPQDSSRQLMFETCVNRRSELSALRDVGFRAVRGVARSARRTRMRRKRLNSRPNLHACTRGCSRCAPQALPSTRFSAPNDPPRGCKRSPIATSSSQRAWFWPHDFACSRVIRASSRNAP
jgi:hypothetical protein